MKKEPEDRNKLKIASFRTTDGDWFDFSQAAESNGFTATDVLKACMVDYQTGAYIPNINTPVSMRIQSAQLGSIDDVEKLVSTAVGIAISNLSILSTDQVIEIASSEAHKATQPIFDDVLEVRKELAEVKSDCDLSTEGIQRLIADALSKASPKPKEPASTAAGEGIGFQGMKDLHPVLDVKRSQKAAEINEALSEAGLSEQYRYSANKGKFHPIKRD